MSEVDWSKAPEGATHYLREAPDCEDLWLKACGDGVRFWTNLDWVMHWDQSFVEKNMTLRPLIRSGVGIGYDLCNWDGEGLPPAGVECEVLTTINWRVCKILYMGGDWVVFEHKDAEFSCLLCSCEFRPLKTEGDKSYEEMMTIWREGDGDVRTFCRDLYLKGYRRIPDA